MYPDGMQPDEDEDDSKWEGDVFRPVERDEDEDEAPPPEDEDEAPEIEPVDEHINRSNPLYRR